MHIGSELRTLRSLAARLPFDLDDSEKANLAFREWAKEHNEGAKFTADLWTYCFVRRYYLQKFAREASFQISDFDELVANTYRKIELHTSHVNDPDRYAQWVSKICKNTFINYAQARRKLLPLDGWGHGIAAETASVRVDFTLLYGALLVAISRLPGFLQGVARLRFVERRSYEEIARLTGKSLPVVRAYASKALARFRKDTQLRASLDPIREEILSG